MPTQDNATAVAVTGSSSAGWTGKIFYNDDNGDPCCASSTNDKIVEQIKFIRDKWADGKSVNFSFELDVDGITIIGVTTTTPKPSGS
jgi:hypothetical protein